MFPSHNRVLGSGSRKSSLAIANGWSRGSKFLAAWMGFLEENADLRYPNLADIYVDEQKG
jgi:hypothetical protein